METIGIRRLAIIGALAGICASGCIHYRKATIEVFDADTKEPISDAHVTAIRPYEFAQLGAVRYPHEQQAQTDEHGQVRLMLPLNRPLDIRARHPGYPSSQVPESTRTFAYFLKASGPHRIMLFLQASPEPDHAHSPSPVDK